MTKVHVIFGTERLADLYGRHKGLLGQYVILATHPELLEKVASFAGKLDIVAVRYSIDVWTPLTDACRRRTTETEDILKRLQRLGSVVKDEHI